jgi:helix-turn-helix protein
LIAGMMKRSRVCRLLDMSPRTVMRLRLAGKLTGRRVDGRWYFTEASVKAFLAGRNDVNTVAVIAEGVVG